MKATIERFKESPSIATGERVNVSDVERVLSLAGGAVAIGYGLSRRSVLGVLTALAGAPFVWRAVSGHCAVKQAVARRRGAAI